MAKKKKQKKAGLIKRQSSKQNRKKALKRKELARRPIEKKQMNRSQVKKTLKNLPHLVFEPELQQILFTPEQLSTVTSQHEKTPDQIEAIATDEFITSLTETLNTMEQRYTKEVNKSYTMMVKAVLYFMGQSEEAAPSFLNQIIVSLFFVSKAKAENTDLTRKDLEILLDEYDKKWESYMEEKMESLKKETMPATDSTSEPGDYEEEIKRIEESAFTGMLEEFADYLTADPQISDDQAERFQEDVEVLFDDYFGEKEITTFEGFRVRKIKNFVEGWFIRNMHPTAEDISSLLDALVKVSEFLENKGEISSEDSQKVLAYLENRDEILGNTA